MPTPRGYKHRKLSRVASCAAGSFRRVKSGKALVTVCCPRGKWKRGHCTVGMRAVGLDKPKKFGAPNTPSENRRREEWDSALRKTFKDEKAERRFWTKLRARHDAERWREEEQEREK